MVIEILVFTVCFHLITFFGLPFAYLTDLHEFVIISGALMMDHENKKEIDSMTTQWLEQLISLQDKHGEDVSDIHIQAEKSLVKDYLVYKIFFPFVEFLHYYYYYYYDDDDDVN
jgi:hypothetical protein